MARQPRQGPGAGRSLLLYALHKDIPQHAAAKTWLAPLAVLQLSPNGRLCPSALAIEHDTQLHSGDSDFRRFPGLRYRDPLR